MANIYCVKCGIEGDSKCPFCRNIRVDHDTRTGQIETILSYRLKMSDEGILIKRWRGIEAGSHETDFEILKFIKEILTESTEAELKIFACVHEWEFKPFEKSDISCSHGCEEKPLLDYMADAWFNLTHGVRYSPKGTFCSICQKPDQWCEHIKEPESEVTPSDLEAAQIIHEALDAIEAGVDWKYERKEKA